MYIYAKTIIILRLSLTLFLISPWCFIILTAQDVHIYYDAFRDSMYYLQNGKPTSTPSVRDGKNVVLHLENYNNYLVDVTLEVEDTEIKIANSTPEGGLSGLLPMGGGSKNPLDLLFKGSGDKMLGAFRMFPGLSGKDLKEGSGWGASPEETARKEQIAQLKKAEAEFEQVRDQVFELDAQLVEMEDKAQAK